MRILKYIAALSLIFLPLTVSAQSVPDFPMAFWGTVTLNGSPAPAGTVVNAYYGSTLAGSATVQDAGVYGYTEPTKQKLLIGSGSTTITYKVTSPGFNGGAETTGDTLITYPAFSAGETVEKNLAFSIIPASPPPPSPSPSPPSSGGGGGGGGGGFFFSPPPAPPATTTATTTSTTSSSTTLPVIAPIGQVLGASTYNFTRLLKRGMSGDDVLELQKILVSLNFLQIDSPTNFFGGLTEAALKAYQKANNLEPVGYLGPKTRALLSAGSAPSAQMQTLIQALMAQLQVLLAKIAELKAQQASSTTQ